MNTDINNVTSALLVCLGGKKFIPCQNFKEASEIINEFIDKKDLGSRDFYNKINAGKILHHTKGIIATVSYNGRVWNNDGQEIINLLDNNN